MGPRQYFGTKVRVVQYDESVSVVVGSSGLGFELYGDDAALMARNIQAGLHCHGDAESAAFADYMDRLVATYEADAK